MKILTPLVLAILAGANLSAFAASPKPAECPKDYLGGVVTSTKMEGPTLVVGYADSRNNIRIRKKDDASTFAALSKIKVGDTHCYPDDGAPTR